jgi:hypothetical protein
MKRRRRSVSATASGWALTQDGLGGNENGARAQVRAPSASRIWPALVIAMPAGVSSI